MQVLANIDTDLFDIGQNPLGVIKQGFACGRQLHTLGVALEQLYTKGLFHVVHTLARRRKRDHLQLRCSGQRTLLMHADEQLEGDEVEPADEVFLEHRDKLKLYNGLGSRGYTSAGPFVLESYRLTTDYAYRWVADLQVPVINRTALIRAVFALFKRLRRYMPY